MKLKIKIAKLLFGDKLLIISGKNNEVLINSYSTKEITKSGNALYFTPKS